ncbi:antibiotic biosynthesis monooxygenase family protein [Micromonospora mangrovi]|uniref:Antibiotic biosynthesis monooxygenase family protein n=2 Tax=Micromonospora TaxID=1873 RepID=A0AAU7M787_9ACTN
MIIVAGWYTVAPEDRDKVVESHAEMVGRARKADGNLDLAISADPVDPGRVNMFELWESEDALNAWRAIANPPAQISEIRGGDVQKHEISKSGPPY